MHLKPKNISIANFKCSLPEITLNGKSPYPIEQIINLDRKFSHQILIWDNMYDFSDKELALFPNLTHFINWGTNDKNIKNMKTLTEGGISVKKVDTYCTETLPEYIVMLLLSYERRLDLLLKGEKYIGNEIHNKVIGIIGMGKIGFRSAQILQKAFHAKIIYYSRSKKNIPNFTPVSLQKIFQSSDYLIIATKGSNFSLDITKIQNFNKNLVIINIVDDEVLPFDSVNELCRNKKIRGYIGDIKLKEKISSQNIDPHIWIINHFGYLGQEAKEIKKNILQNYLKQLVGVKRNGHKVFILRHGTTLWNKQMRLQGQQDSPLSDEGIIEAEKMGILMKKERIKCIFTSPLGRALETARIIAKKTNAKVIIVPELREMNFGIFEGKNKQAVQELFKEFFTKREKDSEYKLYTPYPEGESYFDLYIRLYKKITEILLTNVSFAIVGHESINRVIRGIIRDLDLRDMVVLRQKNHEIISIDLSTGEEKTQGI